MLYNLKEATLKIDNTSINILFVSSNAKYFVLSNPSCTGQKQTIDVMIKCKIAWKN